MSDLTSNANTADSKYTSLAQFRFVVLILKKWLGITEPMFVSIENTARMKC